MKNSITLAVFLFCCRFLAAQAPPACPNNIQQAADLCEDVCVPCTFTGYTGTTLGFSGQAPPGFCGTVESEQWLGFVAGSPNISFQLVASNCEHGDGVQVSIYEACATILACNDGSSGGAAIPLDISYSNFIPGKSYMLMVDGWAGDVCDFQISVTGGSATAPSVGAASTPQGPAQSCPGDLASYQIPAVSGAGYYTWIAPAGSSINGGSNVATIPAPEGTSVNIVFGSINGQVCVQPSNSCSVGAVACRAANILAPPQTILPDTAVCANALPYTLPWGREVTQPGIYYDTLSSALGCDSLLRQTLSIIPVPETLWSDTAVCANALPYTLPWGRQVAQPGTYRDTLSSVLGCDSLLRQTLSIIPVPEMLWPDTAVCANDLPYTLPWGRQVTQPGIYYDTLSSVLGCDSLLRQTLNIIPVPETVWPDTAVCANALPYILPWGRQVTQPGMYHDTLSSVLGCDSLLRQTLSIIPVPETVWPDTAVCAKTLPYTLPWGRQVAQSGTYYDTLSSVLGCDSLLRQTISVIEVPETVWPDMVICANALPYTLPWGQQVAQSGTYYDTLSSVLGCDSLLRQTISVVLVFETLWPDTAVCISAMPYTLPWGDLVSQSGTYYDTLSSGPGCDSVLRQTLIVVPIVETVLPDTAVCVNALPYTLPWGQQTSLPGTYQGVVPASTGCDSLLTQTLSVAPLVEYELPTATLCAGDTNWVCGQKFWTAGVHTAVCPAVQGCDTLITFTLEVANAATVISNDSELNCSGNTVQLQGTFTGIQSFWFNETGKLLATASSLLVQQPGTYILLQYVPVGGNHLCPVKDSITLAIADPVLEVHAEDAVLNCLITSVELHAAVNIPNPVFDWTGPGNFSSNSQDPVVTLPGDYTVAVTNSLGCSGVAVANVVADTLPPSAGILLVQQPETGLSNGLILLSVPPGNLYTFDWYLNGMFLSQEQNLYGLPPGTYQCQITGPNGCSTTLDVVLENIVSTEDSGTPEAGWQVFPNPGSGVFYLSREGLTGQSVDLAVWDMAGRAAWSARQQGQDLIRLECQHLLPGVYYLEIQWNNQKVWKRLVVQR